MGYSQKGWRQRVFLSLCFLAGILAGVASCSLGPTWQNMPSLTDPKIKAGPAETFVKPETQNYRAHRLAILPFRVPTTVPDVSYPITEVFHRELLENKTFLGVVRVAEYHNTLADAQRIAKAHGADLFMVGEVPYFLDSGTMGKSGLQVDLQVMDTSTGRTIWYLTDTISSTPRGIIDLWVTETKPKPSASISYLVASLAGRMCHSLENELEQCIQQGLCTPNSNVNGKKK